MSLFIFGMKLGRCFYKDIVKHNNSLLKLCHNLNKNDGINLRRFSSIKDLTDKQVKNCIKVVADVYQSKKFNDSDFGSIIRIREVINLLEDRLALEENIKNLDEISQQDEDMKKLSEEEYSSYNDKLEKIDEKLIDKILDNLGRDSCRDIIFEITAGVGGQEAMIFTSDLCQMYEGHFQQLGYSYELIEINEETGIKGVRHASYLISDDKAFELLRHEGGIHRVQRVPATEKFGRMQTSTASVAVLPQPSEIEIDLPDRHLKIETKKATGPGGQCVNTTDSAVRITHLPTGIAVECQSQRTQISNKRTAMMKLRSKLYDKMYNEQKASTDTLRKKQRGLGQRNEKIRTYNFSQDRITDHRLSNGTMHNLKGFMEGGEGLKDLQKNLQRQFQLKILQGVLEKFK